MTQHVDEAGRDGEPGGVEHVAGLYGRVDLADLHDPIAIDGDVRDDRWPATPVVDVASPDDEVEGHPRLST